MSTAIIPANVVELFRERCPACGAPTMRADECSDCWEKSKIEARRRTAVSRTIYNMPPRYRWARFDAKELPERVRVRGAIDKARQAVDDGCDRVLFLGPAGSGKTVSACCCLVRKIFERGTEDGVIGDFVDCFALSAARAQSSLGDEPALVTRALSAHVLVLDDLGAEKDIHGSAVAEVLHERHAHMRHTIVTTGFTLEHLAGRYGDGIARRLAEGARIIDLGAK
jgi:DNA replication protein DnaC